MPEPLFPENQNALGQDLFFELIEKFLAGKLDESEAERLLPFFEQMPDLPETLRKQVRLDVLLQNRVAFPEFYRYTAGAPDIEMEEWVRQAALEAEKHPPVHRTKPKKDHFSRSPRFRFPTGPFVSRAVRWILSLTLLLLFCGVMIGGVKMYWFHPSKKVIGHLTDARKAVWADPSMIPEIGGPIHEGSWELLEGVAAVKLLDGAEIVLEGPTEFEFEPGPKIKLREGRLSADVPPQRRVLLIGTPQMEIKVLGTAFWVNADKRQTDVHLLRGKLELNSSALGRFQLSENEAFSLPSFGDSKRFTALIDSFIPVARVASRAEELGGKRYAAWQKNAETLNARRDLLIRFDFQQSDGNRLENLAGAGKDRLLTAQIIGCRPVDGRWSGKKALSFNGQADRIAFSLPGTFDALTLIASIRIDSLNRPYHGILMSDFANSAQGLGRLHWQIAGDGSVRASLSPQGSNVLSSVSSPKIVKSHEFGNWLKLTLVVDTRSQTIVQYLNGRKVSSGKLPPGLKPELGSANLGFWMSGKAGEAARSFHGAMDEFLLFDRALTDEDIRNL